MRRTWILCVSALMWTSACAPGAPSDAEHADFAPSASNHVTDRIVVEEGQSEFFLSQVPANEELEVWVEEQTEQLVYDGVQTDGVPPFETCESGLCFGYTRDSARNSIVVAGEWHVPGDWVMSISYLPLDDASAPLGDER